MSYGDRVGRMIQIRNVPDDLHQALKARATEEGKSLSDLLLEELELIARTPTVERWLQELEKDDPVDLGESPEDLIRRQRDSR